MKKVAILVSLVFLTAVMCAGQNPPASGTAGGTQASPPLTQSSADYSGMYSFLREGEFVQVTIEDAGHVTGFVSRYGDLDSDKGAFLDHFFKDGKLDGSKLNFTTEIVHGVWFDFKGVFERGEGKNPGDEAYYILKGALTESTTDASKKTQSKTTQVALKSFPQDLGATPQK
jgi:hypothetical protein